MTTYFYIYISILALLILTTYISAKRDYDNIWPFTLTISIIFGMVALKARECRFDHAEETSKFELLSLVTNPQTSGSISGSGFIGTSISGSIGSESYASFAFKNQNCDIKVLSIPCSKITFRESDAPIATIYKEIYYNKLAFTKKDRDEKKYSDKNYWIIEVPKENIGRYIRVD